MPLLALALMMFERLVAFERQSVREGLVSNARSLAGVIDNEIDTHTAVAASLATSPKSPKKGVRGRFAFKRPSLSNFSPVPGFVSPIPRAAPL